jgi:steroid 5-alpha reductase family enzyme
MLGMENNHSGRTRQRHGIAVGEGAIRKIFPVFVLVMWIVTGLRIAQDEWSTLNWAMVVVAALCCAVLWVNFVYVFNYGYALSTFFVNLLVLAWQGVSLGGLIIGGLLMIYGLRLFLFVRGRYAQPGFAGRKAGLKVAHQQLPTPIKVLLYLQTTTLMAYHAMTTYNISARADETGGNGVTPFVIVGAVILAVGLIVEAISDAQKQRAKVADDSRWIDSGLFSRSRHPNYLGEIIVQVGIIVAGLGSADGSLLLLISGIIAPLYIVILMLSATTGGELSKEKKYGENADFRAYAERSGALLPRLRG